ncbi:hypothetical protein BpHYR1_032426, partial [Brachionus plicatilis]
FAIFGTLGQSIRFSVKPFFRKTIDEIFKKVIWKQGINLKPKSKLLDFIEEVSEIEELYLDIAEINIKSNLRYLKKPFKSDRSMGKILKK